MTDIAIRVENLSKQYRIGGPQARYKTIRESLTEAVQAPFQRAAKLLRGQAYGAAEMDETIWALKDVSFEVKRGEVVGIIGRNGAGKTTLLKVLSRITEPTEGYAEIHGRVGSLLEVGTGFHPELTGRENITLNGAILGMKRAEIDRKFDEIVAFAEIERFIDTPVKHCSSGMYVRLAFAVAAHLEPEILMVDEVLAVGDAAFQKKCLGKMDDVAKGGRTVLFVSHNMTAVSQLCTRGILLSDGLIACQGPIGGVMDTYLVTLMDDIVSEVVFPEREGSAASFTRICLRNEKGEKVTRFLNSEPIILEMEYVVRQTLSHGHIFVLLDRADGLLLIKSSDDDGGQLVDAIRTPGRYVRRVRFPGGMLNEGVYRFRVVIGKRRGIEHDARAGSYFEIVDMTDYTNSCFGKRNGVLLFSLMWSEQKVESW